MLGFFVPIWPYKHKIDGFSYTGGLSVLSICRVFFNLKNNPMWPISDLNLSLVSFRKSAYPFSLEIDKYIKQIKFCKTVWTCLVQNISCLKNSFSLVCTWVRQNQYNSCTDDSSWTLIVMSSEDLLLPLQCTYMSLDMLFLFEHRFLIPRGSKERSTANL